MRRKKIDLAEKDKRIRQVQEWLLQDFITADILRQCVTRWGVSQRQGARYLADARKTFETITEKNLAKRLNYHLHRRTKLLRDIDPKYKNQPQGIAAQLAVLRDIADLEQLYKAKLEVSGPDGKPIKTQTTHRVIFEDYGK